MTRGGPCHILYLPHDLSDPAVAKRAAMLRDGGATVTLAGFRRSTEAIRSVAGCEAVDWGRTFNGGFAQRLMSVLKMVFTLGKHRSLFEDADLILARNLEMLAIGARGRGMSGHKPALVYESLDIHRLLLKKNALGSALRLLEGWLAKRASALITSSPAFVDEYFKAMSHVKLPARLVENKVYPAAQALSAHSSVSQRVYTAPWKIGWFGAIRCNKSLRLLTDLARNSNGSVEVIIRGRPALDQFEDFYASVNNVPGLRFLGPYKNPDELAAIYSEVHFTWAIDMFEEGLNSSWLLPNRLYEGGVYGSVPIAAEDVETGRFLKRLGIGVTISDPKDTALAGFFGALAEDSYRGLEKEALSVAASTWIYSTQDCKDLVDYLSSLA